MYLPCRTSLLPSSWKSFYVLHVQCQLSAFFQVKSPPTVCSLAVPSLMYCSRAITLSSSGTLSWKIIHKNRNCILRWEHRAQKRPWSSCKHTHFSVKRTNFKQCGHSLLCMSWLEAQGCSVIEVQIKSKKINKLTVATRNIPSDLNTSCLNRKNIVGSLFINHLNGIGVSTGTCQGRWEILQWQKY